MENITQIKYSLNQRFRGFYPVVVDVETGGINPNKDALLELAAVTIEMDENGKFYTKDTFSEHVIPFEGANLDQKSLEFNKIDPHHPFRFALDEKEVLNKFFDFVKLRIKKHDCSRAVLVGHNAWFDLNFLLAATNRCKIKKHPFHRFTCFDTATLSGMAFGQTVLSKAALAANIEFNENHAHSAIYDTKKTAELFCYIINRWQNLGGWKDFTFKL